MLEAIREQKLDNGLTILCLKKHGAPIVAAQIWYQTGSCNEIPGIRGISHFVEHLMFRGSEHVASEEHSHKINDVGGHCNAFTAEDVTAYLNSVPSGYLDMVLQLEADRMRSLTLDPVLFETEKKVIVEEFHTYLNNPVTKSFLEFRTAFYQDHPYATSPLGTMEDITAISVEDCRRYHDRWYRPENAVVTVVGDFNDEGEVCDLVGRHFGDIRKPAVAAAPNSTLSDAFVPRTGQWMKRKIDFDVPILLMGYPAPPSASADALPLEILQIIFSQGETSRLHRSIVR
jgi:zinc protease